VRIFSITTGSSMLAMILSAPQRQGLLERDEENSYLAGDAGEADPMDQLLGASITYRITP
jgi:hypothetical protein